MSWRAARPAAAALDEGRSGEAHLPDDRFVPVRDDDLVDAIEADRDRFPQVHDRIGQLAEALARVIDQEATAPPALFLWVISSSGRPIVCWPRGHNGYCMKGPFFLRLW